MARYLVVAHQTAQSPELVSKLQEIARGDTWTEFVLLVPATKVENLLTWTEGESYEIAQRRAEAAKQGLQAAGINITRASVGDEMPIQAIDDELLEHPNSYDAIVLCTLPAGVSRWLQLDLPNLAKRKYNLPVIHVVADRRAVDVKQ